MTCYETLKAPAFAADAPMAHQFVKWWRNKFRNGYKKFSIGTESERTDTEELVGRAASQCSAPPDLLPSEARALLQPATPPPQRHQQLPADEDKQPRMRFEELTCDVELQHPESSKQKPVQFSFTLYDLDGHGRMTKDDIAGIVSTIYESIGKSVTVPHYGSKTIQVRLTVVPEDENSRSYRDRREGRRRRRRETATTLLEENEQSEEEHRERSPGDDVSSKSSCSADRRPQQRPQPLQPSRTHRYHRKEHRERKHTKKRSGSLQRRELFEIIQANMEKNHLSFQSSRKPCDPVPNEEEIKSKYQKLRNRSYTISEKPTKTFHTAKSDNSGHGYLDLACGGDSNLCRYDRYLHAVICSSARHAHTGFHQKQAQAPRPRCPAPHPRSRSHDLPTLKSQHPRVLQIIFL
ncbi:NKD inhibitor of WNT signaling pathway naked cuticle [Choristoneura fumiferana]|uniref:NKD inhibitor of WNT signaling pathway naked cuticle n=1 Tax=Choristoneura fumiferana TaxID=7141 RepID=UPI003D156468